MKHLNAMFQPRQARVHDAGAVRQLVSSMSFRDRPANASRVGPSVSAAETEESRPNSFRSTLQQIRAKTFARRLPSVNKFLGVLDDRMTGSGRLMKHSGSNRRIRRREFHFTPAEPTPEKLKKLRYVIMPKAPWKVRWDIWIGIVIIYSVVMIPYRIGFAIDLAHWEQIVNYLFDASFALDVMFNMFTGFYDDDVFVYELPKIRARYFKSWFFVDILSTLPFDQFFQAVTTGADQSFLSFKLLRTIRLFRLLKLMRLLRLKRAIDSFQLDALNAHVFQTFRSLLMIIFIIHLLSCGWYMFYTWDPTGMNWVTNIDRKGFQNPYLVSFYWVSNTMMSVGYGEIYGVTDGERLYSIFVECLGSISVGLIIANIQMLTDNYNPRGVKMKQKLQETKEFLLKRLIPRRLRLRVISQFEYHWSRRTVFDEDKLLQQFPMSLQYEILAASMETFVKKFPVFGMTSVDFFVFTIPKLRPIVVGPGQVLVECESVWEELYFVLSGSLEAFRSNIIASSLTGGDICGIEYLVGDRRRYAYTYRSTSKTELYAIYSADLMEAMTKCPIASRYLRDLAHIISERYSDAARRGRRILQKKDASQRKGSIDLFVQYRHRKSTSYHNLRKDSTDISQFQVTTLADEVQLHWSVIRHYSRTRLVWDSIMGIVVAWTAVSVPFTISFDIPESVILEATDRMSDLFFCLDIFINFFTTYVDDTGVEIVDRHEIRRHYLKRSFLPDVISTIPFDFLVETVTESKDFRSLKLIRTIKLVKLLRLVRISKLLKLNSQWMSDLDISMDTIRLLKMLIPVLMIGHYVGCFWYYLSADGDRKRSWWGRIYFDDPSSLLSRYVASVYWATTTMTTVGFGDVVAVNSHEQAYSIFVMIGGTTLFAYVVGTVIEVVSNSKSLMNREHEMGQRINAYIKERGVSREFVVACQEHLRYINAEKTLFNEYGLFDALSHSLRCELILYLNSNVLAQIRFFDKKPKWFLTLLLPQLVPQFFLSGDLLIYHGNLVSGIFFLMSGAVIARVPIQEKNSGNFDADTRASPKTIAVATNGRTMDKVPEDDGTIATVYEGEFFGYKEVLTKTSAQYNVFACRPTGTYILPAEYLDVIDQNYPDVLEEMRGLFLHSITKQQTILQHWQNNEIMGISGQERDRILRSSFAMPTHLAHVREMADFENDSMPSRPESRQSGPMSDCIPNLGTDTSFSQTDQHFLPATTRQESFSFWDNNSNQPLPATSEILSTPTLADDYTHPSLVPEAPSTEEEDHSYKLRQPKPSNVEMSIVRSHSAKISRQSMPHIGGARRRSIATSSRTITSERQTERPPLRRYPSQPDEISALVGKLLEVEGYVTSPPNDCHGRP